MFAPGLQMMTLLAFAFITPSCFAQDIRWMKDAQQAVNAAHVSGRPIVVSIGAEWCHFCKQMDRDTWRHPAVAKELTAHYISLKLSDEEHATLIQALGVQAYPATLFFTSDRRLIKRIDGFVGADELLRAAQHSNLQVP